MEPLDDLIAQNLRTLDQALALIDRLDDASFRAVGPGFENGSIGGEADGLGLLLRGELAALSSFR